MKRKEVVPSILGATFPFLGESARLRREMSRRAHTEEEEKEEEKPRKPEKPMCLTVAGGSIYTLPITYRCNIYTYR